MKKPANRSRGFTLVEIAVVMVLIGIVMTMGLKMVVSTLENASFSETKSKQERIKFALLGYLRTNGRLPCPDNSVGDTTVATGIETSPCNTAAADGYGVVPWQTLGISRDSVIDGWGNYFTYRVANGMTLKNWTAKTDAATHLTVNELKTPTAALLIQELDAAGTALSPTIANAVVVILSHGKNGFGAKTTKVVARLPTADIAAGGEMTNATVGTAAFVLRPVNDATTAFNGPYDDLVTYMLPQDLLQPMVTEGTLKACVAYCPSSGAAVCTAGGGTCTCATSGVTGMPVFPCTACGTCTEVVSTTGCMTNQAIPIGAFPVTCL